MTPVKDRWTAEYKRTFDDVEINPPEEWEIEPTSDIPVYHKRRSAALWTALAVLAVALAVLAAYGYSVMSSQNSQLAWLPSLAKSISALGTKTAGLETNMKEWGAKQDRLAAQVKNLGTGWQARLDDVRQHADALVASTYQKEREELNQRMAMLNSQIAEMSTQQHADRVQMARLEQELASTRQELAAAREQSAREIADVREQQISNQRELASINSTLSTDQVNFEAQKDHDEEIVPGVTLHVTRTDVSHQKFGGWIWLAENGRRIWVRRQAIEAPVVFYPKAGGEAYELVITRVSQKDVAGYMLVPGTAASRSADVASNSQPTTSPGEDSF
jgi:predicted  nucleic acid-binding Zn-ribbon protein